MIYRTGQGIDFHRLVEGRPLMLGGVRIPSVKGCEAHSDGDALLHAICDALLGAAGLNDIGHHFPDNDETYRNIDSRILLEKTISLVKNEGYSVGNIDSTVCLEKPRIAPFIPEMRKIIAAIAEVDEKSVSVKATTTEKMGFAGRGEGLFAVASVLLVRE
ncbi:MAG TPA: 2-C-methyl-D-erythritol 2,4-cyclodiphosphate synthase [Bacteroidales bacterium]|nr:2-C-methyl-D-erythritol 2,4-cyclodiphosphate synthase [Bacteroidales bacterium]HRR94383.1 2-C-methyl-D-erythritol 2,4-cyclodiphosphate synthase [Bacteroidales bacterium]HRT89664.1 2-C-methyl-D-erythritol 2,4-cyclodiphosphate synthase [Bacteroidales bacterium]